MENISIAILCGGKSSRFKSDHLNFMKRESSDLENKLNYHINGYPLYEINYRKFERYTDDIFLQGMNIDSLRCYDDIYEDKGPLGGIYSALQNANYEKVLVIAGDMPLLKTVLIDEFKKFLENLIIVPRWSSGYLEPLCSIYSKSTSKYIEDFLKNNILKISDIYDHFKDVKYLSIQNLIENGKITENCFININTNDDLGNLVMKSGYEVISNLKINNTNITKT